MVCRYGGLRYDIYQYDQPDQRGVVVQSNGSGVTVVGPRYRYKRRRSLAGRVVWGGLLRVLQRITHYNHGDHLEFKLSFSVRDLVTDKGRAVKDQMESLVRAVQKAGSYQARDEAARAVHAVMDGMKGWVPPDALSKMSESAPVREAARLGRAAAQRLQKGETVSAEEAEAVSGEGPSSEAPRA